MNFLDLYYYIKPLIPRPIQLALRQEIIRRKLEKVRDIWPIDPEAGNPPPGWKGWPEGKKFALVLTHDVDTIKGRERCLQLARLEQELGFKSCFNFVGGDYPVYKQIRKSLKEMGFEIGVHGYTHKGNLFRSRPVFEKQRDRINQTLKEWGAVGFRAPSMYHNLEWIGELDIEYDLSTFDTDPFEPQSDGMGTIFPFWVPAKVVPSSVLDPQSSSLEPQSYEFIAASPELFQPNKLNEPNKPKGLNGLNDQIDQTDQINQKGFVELPYTLPQDHLLFIMMKEKSIELLKEKVDWICDKGGMVLVNNHPDYINFQDGEGRGEEYPAAYYREFLEYLKKKYAGQYWHALPREVSQYFKKVMVNRPPEESAIINELSTHELRAMTYELSQPNELNEPSKPKESETIFLTPEPSPLAPRKPLRVCMLSYSFYETDARVKRYGESLVERGDQVEAICLRRNGTPKEDTLRGVKIHRIQDRNYDEKNKWSYLNQILCFFFKSAVFLTRHNLKAKYDLIHVHNVPDFLVFAPIIPKLFGSKIILDIHDILPEFYANKFKTGKSSMAFQSMVLEEKISAAFSDHVIISNHLWEKTLLSRSVKPQDLSVYMNYPDDTLFHPRPSNRNNGRLVMMYPGTLNWHQGVDIAIKAFALIKDEVPELDFHIYGIGGSKGELEELVKDLGLEKRIIFQEFLPLEKVPEVMAGADIGVVPKRDDSFGGEAFSTKILQFMAMGIPVVVSKTRIDQYYFNDTVVKFFKPDDEFDLAARIKELALNKEARQKLATDALSFAQDLTWSRKKQAYLNLVDNLVNKKS